MMCAARPDESPVVLRRERRSAGVDEVGAPAVLRPAARERRRLVALLELEFELFLRFF